MKKLGGGEMGVVYKAEDVKLHRFVALSSCLTKFRKTPQPSPVSSAKRKPLLHLNHPNISTIYEIDDQHSNAFIAMEFLDGKTLKHTIAHRPVELEQLLHQKFCRGAAKEIRRNARLNYRLCCISRNGTCPPSWER